MIEVSPIKDEQSEDLARVAVADFLERAHKIDFGTTSRDYANTAKMFGLSGTPQADYQDLKQRAELGRQAQERLQRRAGRIQAAEELLGASVTADGVIVANRDEASDYDPQKQELYAQAIEFLSASAREDKLVEISQQAQSSKGFLEAFKDNRRDLLPIPIAGAMDNIEEARSFLDLINRYDQGAASDSEELQLYERLAEYTRPRTIGGKVAEITTMMPQFMVDFAIGSPLFTAGRQATSKALQKTIKREAFEALEKKLLGRGLLAAPGLVAGTAAALPVSGAGLALEEYFKALVPDLEARGDTDEAFKLVIGDAPGASSAAREAIASTYIELLSERTGGMLTGIAAPIRDKLVKTALGRYMLKYNPTLKSEELRKVVDSVGFNGVLGEMFEERFADLARFGVGLDEELHVPDLNQLAAELISFSIPAGAFYATDRFLKVDSVLAPENGVSESSWKTADNLFSDADVLAYGVEKYDDAQLAGDMVRAKKGDPEAQARYTEAATLDPKEDIRTQAGLSTEEIEAGLPEFVANDTSNLPEAYYLKQEAEIDDTVRLAALDEGQAWFESIHGDDQKIDRDDSRAVPFMAKVNTLSEEYGWGKNERDAYVYDVLQAAASNLGRDVNDLLKNKDRLTVLGESTVEFIGGVAHYTSKINSGASILDLVEEEVENFKKRYIAEGQGTEQDLLDWKHSVESELGEQTHDDSERGVTEWLSTQGQAWYVKHLQDSEALGKVPATIREWLARFFAKLKAIFSNADLLRKLDSEGRLNEELKTFLNRALGLDEAYLQDRMRQAELEQVNMQPIGEEFMQVVKELGGVPRPDADPAYRGELETYFQQIGKNWKSLKKKGGTLDGLAEALRERGFEQMQTPDDVIEALMSASRGEPIYSNTAGQMQGGSFSLEFTNLDAQTHEEFESLKKVRDWLNVYKLSWTFQPEPLEYESDGTVKRGYIQGGTLSQGADAVERRQARTSDNRAKSKRLLETFERKIKAGALQFHAAFDSLQEYIELRLEARRPETGYNSIASITGIEDFQTALEIFEAIEQFLVDGKLFKAPKNWKEPESKFLRAIGGHPNTFSIGQTETPEFKKWFGDSKVVDQDGKPLVVYHGTNADFEAFNPDFFNSIEENGDYVGEGFFFSNSKGTAKKYSVAAERKSEGKARIVSVYLKIENPFIPERGYFEKMNTDELMDWFSTPPSKIRKRLQKQGYDGLIDLHYGQYAVFSPTQIKSATGNRGTFDPDDPRITYSIGFQDDDADPMKSVRERTPEEDALAEALRELRNFNLSEDVKSEQDRIKLKRKIEILQVKAVESRKRQRLQASGAKKLAKEVERRTKQIRGMIENRDNLKKAIKQIEDLLEQMPEEVKARFYGYGWLADRKTIAGQISYVERATDRINAIMNRYQRKEKRDHLMKLLAPYYTDYGPDRRKRRSRVGEVAFDELYFAAALSRRADAPAPKSISKERENILRNVFTNILSEQVETPEGKTYYKTNQSVERILDAVELAEAILKGGRSGMDMWHMERKQRVESINQDAVETILNGEELKGNQQLANEKADQSAIGAFSDDLMSILFHPFNGLQQMMNMLDGKKGGHLEAHFNRMALDADQRESSLHRNYVEQTKQDLLKIFGTHKTGALWMHNANKRIDTGIDWVDESGKVQQKLTRMQLVDVLAQWGDLSLRPTFDGMKINQATIEKVRELATPYGVKLSEYIRQQYAAVGIDIQATFKATEGYAMDLVEGYGGRVQRAGVAVKADDPMFGFGADGTRPTVKSASMKERVGSIKPIVFGDAFAKYERHMRESHHYISHAALAKDLFSSFFGSNEVKKAIKQRHGDDALQNLNRLIEDIVRGQTGNLGRIDKMLNGLRANVTKASLAIKPAIMIKQLTSWPAFIEEVGFRAYNQAFIEFSKNPMRWMREVYNTDYVKNRLSSSFYADIQQQIKSHSEVLNPVLGFTKLNSLSNVLMLNVKIGDIGAVIFGGTPVYLHTYQQARKRGLNEANARIEAEAAFAASSERAQQSSAMHSRGAYFRDNGLMRSFFMYLTSPIQYQRNVNVALYNLLKAVSDKKDGRPADIQETSKQALRAVLVFHIILPQIFQAVASGLLAFADDDDTRELFWRRQFQTLALGNLNTFPILGRAIEYLAKQMAGNEAEFFSHGTGSPLMDLTLIDLPRSTINALEDGDGEDWLKFLESAAKVSGVPLETFVHSWEAVQDVYEGDSEHPVLRLLGWSEWALGEK